jgi:hypothetical protein
MTPPNAVREKRSGSPRQPPCRGPSSNCCGRRCSRSRTPSYRREHVLLGLTKVLRDAEIGELDGSDQGPCPGAEVLGGELLSHDFSYVG